MAFSSLRLSAHGEQVLAAFKRLALKIRAQSVGEDRNIQIVGDFAELKDLVTRQELGFINQNAMQRF